MKPINLDGQVFGNWKVLHRAPDRGDYVVRWVCVCGCGKQQEVTSANLRKGKTRECRSCAGRRWHARKGAVPQLFPMRRLWKGMKSRCERPADPKYPSYGARGIHVCERWQSFLAFYEDMGPRPSRRHTLDRVNNDGPYEPGNVRWALPVVQSNNRSTNRLIVYAGRTQTLAQWCHEYGASVGLTHARLKRGWPILRALTEPAHKPGGDMRKRAA